MPHFVISNISMYRLLSETPLCKAALRFRSQLGMITRKTRWSRARLLCQLVQVQHTSIRVFRLITIKQIHLTNNGCFSHLPHQRQPLPHASQSALIAGASTEPWVATPLAGSASCLHLCDCLWYSILIWASDDFKCSMILKSGPWQAREAFRSHCIGSCMP